MMDHMVVRLGKYLRALGYDAIWGPGVRTHELILAANKDARWFVTRNTRLPAEYPAPHKLIRVRSDDPVEQLRELRAAFPDLFGGRPFSRCIRCNVPLQPVPDKTSIRDRVHPNVFARYHHFFRCPCCATVFWKGSHVRNTCRKLGIPDDSEIAPPKQVL
jgi:uncharacterized protein with PIN domain